MAAAAVKLYGPLTSPAVARALACILEKKIPYELVPVDMRKGEHKKPSYLAMQPFGQVPAFQDGNLTLFESRAIVRYIAQKYEAQGTIGMWGENLTERALIDQWMEVESQSFNPPSLALLFQIAVAPMMGLTPNQEEINKNEEKLGKVLDVYDQRLSQSKYLAGDEFSIADLSHLPNMEYIVNKTGKSELVRNRKNVNGWWEDISGRPSWKEVAELSKPVKK
ncbi:hypothetical protein SUGI_0070140 [Cryptomeria japonica]|uniref:glutathione S-transferase F9 n=1 Tax=Cryptomeria japonica TaxID=3369 RepID=UPI002408EF01|nr:glutathione S-transferase F9 [Cryptomeria japonica]GLJ07580.1 hypothetical protein SUGI_0070140 [Cryptomeria japonica]